MAARSLYTTVTPKFLHLEGEAAAEDLIGLRALLLVLLSITRLHEADGVNTLTIVFNGRDFDIIDITLIGEAAE